MISYPARPFCFWLIQPIENLINMNFIINQVGNYVLYNKLLVWNRTTAL